MTTILALLFSLLALSSAQQQQQQQQSTGCSFQSNRAPYTLNWVVDSASQNVFFNLTYRNFPQGSFTGVGFGDNMAAGLDVILVTLPQGMTTPQVIDASVQGYTQPMRDSNSEVQTRATSWIGGTLNAQFIRPLSATNGVNKALTGCVTWNFISSPGPAYANGTYSKHSAAPEQQQQCNIQTRCAGTIPAQFINTPNNGAWGNQGTNQQYPNQIGSGAGMNQQQPFYSPYNNNQNQQQLQQQPQVQPPQYNQMNPTPYGNSQQFNQPMQPYQTQQYNQQPYPNQQSFNQQPYQQPYPSNQIGNGAQQQQPYYSPYGGAQNSDPNSQYYGRKKRQAGTNIYGYNTDSNAASNPILVQNPNYMFLPNNLADQYARTYSQASAQYDARNNGGVNGGAQRDPSMNQATQPPVLNNQQQNQKNYQQIQRDSASGAYSTIAPATNIYGYKYDTPSSSGLLSSQLSPTSSSSAANRQFDSPASRATNSVSQRDQGLQRFYNPGVTSAGNVYTGSLYNGGNGPNMGSSGPNSNQPFFNPSSTSGSSASASNGRFFDPTGNTATATSNNGVFYASANRGPQPGQIVYYDTTNVGRKKRSVESIRAKRQQGQVFYDPGNNQSAMYYPYRTETDFNLNGGQRGFSQVGGSPQYYAPQYSAPLNGANGGVNNNGVNGAPGNQRYYDTSRGVYVDSVNVPQFDSRGGNQYLKIAPVNPQSPNFVQTLQNNARALNDYVDSSCSNQDPYWCQSYVAQIMQAQNSFGSYSGGLCNTLVASLQYSDNRCCNAVRAAGCQI